MRHSSLRQSLVILIALAMMGCAADPTPPLSRIAFGSCARENKPQPIWHAVADQDPQLFLMIGDNIYGDSEDMQVLREKYAKLGAMDGYQRVRQTCPLLATWDDHDYGVNDGGVEYPMKAESQQVFLEFFQEPPDSPRWSRPGVYNSYTFGPKGKRVQVILLDTRYFRSPLKALPREQRVKGFGPYVPSDEGGATMLGQEQWTWLQEQLLEPAELRIIASSVQVIPQQHGWEYWANFPGERARLFQLIADTAASGVIFISGDRHLAEISRLGAGVASNPTGYPLYDVTSSSLNQPSGGGNENEPNMHRLGDHYLLINFGMIRIDWSQRDPTVTLEIRDGEGEVARSHSLKLSELRRD